QIQGLSNYIREYLETAYTLNYQLSLNPIIADQIISSDSDWDRRTVLYGRNYNTSKSLGDESGIPFLVKIQQEYDFVDLLYLQDVEGDQTGKSYGNIGHRGDRWWYKEFFARDLSPFISRSYYSLTGNKPVASIFHPVMANGSFIGIMGMDIVFSDLQENVETYLNTKDMYAVVLDNEGVIIAHPDKEKLKEIFNLKEMTKQILVSGENGTILLDNKGNQVLETVALDWAPEISDAVQGALGGSSGYIKNVEVTGIKSTVYYEPVHLPGTGSAGENYAVLLIQGKTEIVRAKIIIIVSTLFLIVFTISLLFAFFHYRFQKFIIDPLEVLIESMNSVDIDNYQIIDLHTNDEFSLMADTYNELRKNLSIANNQLLEKIEMLKEREAGFRTLSEIGLALATENDIDKLMELVLDEAMRLTQSDGGTLYIYDDEKKYLRFEIIRNESMGIKTGSIYGSKVNFPPVPLYKEGDPNYSNVSSYSALTGKVINIPDVYEAEGYDFTGMRAYDQNNGYLSKSMLVIPMMNKDKELIGVMQLINAQSKVSGEIIAYSEVYENLISTLAYQSAVKMTNVQLHYKLKELLHSVIESIAAAIDEKSPFTGKHISNVFQLTMIIADKINKTDKGYFRDTFFTDDQLEELRLAAWMHDIGKITTPENLLNKGTKLHFFRDGIELIETRFQLIKKIYENDLLTQELELLGRKSGNSVLPDEYIRDLKGKIDRMEEDLTFIRTCNAPDSSMDNGKLERILEIGTKYAFISGERINYISDIEVENLSIKTGTLNDGERKVIEDHVRMTQIILDKITFPKNISKVPEYASMHHETLDGKGYHRGLHEKEIPLQARIIAIADIIEALTSKERPYRKPLKHKEVLKILEEMKTNNRIDPEIYKLIVESDITDQFYNEVIKTD
ncbi:MAG: HD domain-containing protein, partial [Spirochaetales bacterium]|nr:HD domain-containing protein [Spirochaetales bacterium]